MSVFLCQYFELEPWIFNTKWVNNYNSGFAKPFYHSIDDELHHVVS